jgi:hypothetical protein
MQITQDAALEPQLLFELTGGASVLSSVAAATIVSTHTITCGVISCSLQFPASDARLHAALHMLSQPQIQMLAVASLKLPCELCASFETQQYTADPTDAGGMRKNQIILIEGSHTLTSDHDTHPSR